MPQAVLSSIVFLIGIELVDLAGHAQGAAPSPRRVRGRHPRRASPSSSSASSRASCSRIVASIIDHLRRSYRPGTKVMQPGRRRRLDAASHRLRHRCSEPRVSSSTASPAASTTPTPTCSSSRASVRRRSRARRVVLPRRRGDPRHRLQRRRDHPPAPRRARRARASSSSSPSRCDVRELLDRYGLTDLLGDDAIFRPSTQQWLRTRVPETRQPPTRDRTGPESVTPIAT